MIKAVRYEITSERIKITTGYSPRQTNAMELYRVKDYTLKEPFFYRLFHLGNIYLTPRPYHSADLHEGHSGARQLMDEIRTHGGIAPRHQKGPRSRLRPGGGCGGRSLLMAGYGKAPGASIRTHGQVKEPVNPVARPPAA